jgi:predicted amidohydrolase
MFGLAILEQHYGGVRTSLLKVAAAQPACTALDVVSNARVHANVVRAAQARVVVFPELSLTGYELDAEPVSCDDPALTPIVEACAATGSLALVGAPVDDAGHRFIAMLAIDAAGVRVAYRKTWLGAEESRRFCPGDGPTMLQVDGWRLGLGICKDTGAAQHTAGTAALVIDAYLAGLVHRPEELPEQEARAVVIARTCQAYVVFASFAGPTGDVFTETAGSSAIWSPNGIAIARTGPDAGGVARATLSSVRPH